jgi:outer membrane protein OmpA-like peptidoglycan-associated protein
MNSVFIRLFSVFIVILCFLCLPATAQKKKLKNGGVIQLNDSLKSYGQSDIFSFPNLHRIQFYSDGSALAKIKAYEAARDEAHLYKSLRAYVKNFGIENFNRNLAMIWQLARLSEKHGPAGEAILLYRLALKHHLQGVNTHALFGHYDSLETDKKKYYVPIEYYYELVDFRKEIDTLRPPYAVLVNMGRDINSPSEDYGPSIGNVDYLLLFTSKRNKQGVQGAYDEDLFYSIKVDGHWTEAKTFDNINSSFNEGSACLSSDGKTLIFSRCNTPESLGNCDLYISKKKRDDTWGEPKNMGKLINSTSWDSHPSLTPSGDTLYFSSNRVGGFGLSDIYYALKDKKGNWSRVLNAGPIINTRKNEVSPFFHHTYNVLYFSSDGHPLNFGDFDIYKTARTNLGFEEPKNIGPLVNGQASEYYFTIDSQSHDLYYARSEPDDPKNLDLFSFPVPMEAQPLAVASLKGKITLSGSGGKPAAGIVSVIDLDKGVEVAPRFLREDGSYNFSLINKRNYLLIIQGDDFFRIEEVFFMNGNIEINKETDPIESKIAFQSLEFENGKADILSTMHADLAKLGNFLLDHPQVKLRISGHTDSQGREEVNLRLSQSRADAIKAYLLQEFKITNDRITAIGYGSAKPAAQEENDDHRQLNRRVEFEIFKN